jgi:hypothetical protein
VPKTNAARDFVETMRPQMQAIRQVEQDLKQKRAPFSDLHGVQILADQVATVATAVEELIDAVAEALDQPRSS